MAPLSFEDVSFSYRDAPALDNVSFALEEGELLVLLGPSGSGKSTVLRLAAGLEAPSAGRIAFGEVIGSLPGRVLLAPSGRRSSLVFQDLALWPHLVVEEQIAFAGPVLRAAERGEILRSVSLEKLAGRLPAHMSGGERQRLALARALASRPRLLLLDEPFAHLDPTLRLELRALLLDLHRNRRVAMLYVTHDLEDAFELGDRIVVLNRGRVEQIGRPEDLYRRPETTFVAAFTGRGALVEGWARGRDLELSFGTIPNPRPEVPSGAPVVVVIRPEDVEIAEDGLPASVASVRFGAGAYSVELAIGGERLWTRSTGKVAPGETVGIRLRHGWPIRR